MVNMKIRLVLSTCFVLVTLIVMSTPEIQSATDFSSKNVEPSTATPTPFDVEESSLKLGWRTSAPYLREMIDVFQTNDFKYTVK